MAKRIRQKSRKQTTSRMEDISPLGPTPERLRMAGADVEEFQPSDREDWRAIRLLDGSPLEKLATLGQSSPSKGVTGDQYHAGCRYYADAYRAGMMASGVIDTTREAVDSSTKPDIASSRIEAMTALRAANRALKPTAVDTHLDIVEHVLIREMALLVYAENRIPATYYPTRGKRRDEALSRLRAALDVLDAHYYPRRRGLPQYGGVEGYRPEVRAAE